MKPIFSRIAISPVLLCAVFLLYGSAAANIHIPVTPTATSSLPPPFYDDPYIAMAERIHPSIVVIEAGPVLSSAPDTPPNNENKPTEETNKDNPKIIFPYLIKLVKDTRAQGMREYKLGSGWVCGTAGKSVTLICTDFHVIEDTEKIIVKRGAKKYVASAIVNDPKEDITVLAIQTNDSDAAFPILPLGDSDKLQVASVLLSEGHPFGSPHKTVTGIFSGWHIEDAPPYLQLDMTVNVGQSGSPIVNRYGEVMGMTNMAIVGRGIGFAIPINRIKPRIDEAKKKLEAS